MQTSAYKTAENILQLARFRPEIPRAVKIELDRDVLAGSLINEIERWERAEAALNRRIEEVNQYKAVLERLLNHYVSMVNSGDCGSWDPEDDAPVIQARSVLAGHKLTVQQEK